MGVNLNIRAYEKNRSNTFNKIYILNFTIGYTAGYDSKFWAVYGTGLLAWQSLQIINDTYGLAGRRLIGSNGDGRYTDAVISGIELVYVGSTPFAMITHRDWSNQSISGQCWTEGYQKPIHRYFWEETLDCSEEIVEGDIKINFRVETNEVMDLEHSFGEFIINASSDVVAFFNKYEKYPYEGNREYVFGMELKIDGESEAWMGFKRRDIIYDEINQDYIIKCYDWVKIQLEEIQGEFTPVLTGSSTTTVAEYLSAVFENFYGTPLVNTGDMSDEFNVAEYRSYWYGTQGFTEGYYISPNATMTVGQFLAELQKHYAGFVYYDKNRQLRFTQRNYLGNELNIDELIVEDTFHRVVTDRDSPYMALNVQNWDLGGGLTLLDGWAIAQIDLDGNMIAIEQTGSDAEINRIEGIIDFRQRLPTPIRRSAVFEVRTAQERANDYEELFADLERYRCTVDYLDVNIFDKIIYNGKTYKANAVSKDYINQVSELELFKVL